MTDTTASEPTEGWGVIRPGDRRKVLDREKAKVAK